MEKGCDAIKWQNFFRMELRPLPVLPKAAYIFVVKSLKMKH
jgi:hypothetical protein